MDLTSGMASQVSFLRVKNGINPQKVKYGIGLKNIKDSTKIVQDELKITSSSENGTTIEIVY
jgi:sensor histidine kinase YesM